MHACLAHSIALEAARAAELRRTLFWLEGSARPNPFNGPWEELQAALETAAIACSGVADGGCVAPGTDPEKREGIWAASVRLAEWVSSTSAPARRAAARASAAACLLVTSSSSVSVDPRGSAQRDWMSVPGSSVRVAAASCAAEAQRSTAAAEALSALVQHDPPSLDEARRRRAAKRSRPGAGDRLRAAGQASASCSHLSSRRCPAALLWAQCEESSPAVTMLPALQRFRLAAASQACAAVAAAGLRSAAEAALLEPSRRRLAGEELSASSAAWPASPVRERVLAAVRRLGWVVDQRSPRQVDAFGGAARPVFRCLVRAFCCKGSVGIAAAMRGLADAASIASIDHSAPAQEGERAAGAAHEGRSPAAAALGLLFGALAGMPGVCEEDLAGLEALVGDVGGDAAAVDRQAAALCITIAAHLRRDPATWQEWAGLLAAFPALPAACCNAALASTAGEGAASLAGWALGPSPLPPAARGFWGPTESEASAPKAVRIRGGTFVTLPSLQRICSLHARLLRVSAS